MNDVLQCIQERRSIRKYQEKQIPLPALQQILQAGLYAPSAGGGQRSTILAVHDRELAEKLGRLNLACFDRKSLAGSYVSAEQPSIIDDPTLKSGFYGAPTVCIIFGPKTFLYSVPDAFCCAQNMALAAHALGISSCIVARGEDTFDSPEGAELLKRWDIPSTMTARCFLLLGYCQGVYPPPKPRREGRAKIVTR